MNEEIFKSSLSRLFDNDLSDKEFIELEKYLESSAAARAVYLERVNLQNVMELELASLQQPSRKSEGIIPVERMLKHQRERTLRLAAYAAVALIVVGLITLQTFFVASSAAELTFEVSPQSRFSVTHSEDQVAGSTLKAGSRLQLSQGVVQLTFESGVKAVVLAPADFTLNEDNKLSLALGRAWFDVPAEARGFTVVTDDFTVVDLGTEFGVHARAFDSDEVHVFKGLVSVETKTHEGDPDYLSDGQARRVSDDGELVEILADAGEFVSALPSNLPAIHWSFDGNEPFTASGYHPAAVGVETYALDEKKRPDTAPGKSGRSLLLNGKGQSLVTNWRGFDGSRPRTVSCWIQLDKDYDYSNYSGIVGWGDFSGKTSKWKVLAAQKDSDSAAVLRISWGDHWIDGSTELADGEWHQVVVSTTGRLDAEGRLTAELYVDGSKEQVSYHSNKDATAEQSLDTHTNTLEAVPLTIGSSLQSDLNMRKFFKGKIDELTIFDGHMAEAEVRQRFNFWKNEQ